MAAFIDLGYNASAYADGGLGARLAHDASLTLLYRFAQGRTLVASDGLGPTLPIVRATEGRFYGADRILQTAASGVARFDYNPVTGESLGLLVEEARTNLMLQSQDVSASPWTTLLTPIINIDSSIAPDGTLTMNSINDNNGAGFEGVVQQITIPDDSATYTFSLYIEKTSAGSAPTMGVNVVLIGGTNPGDLPIPRIFTDTGFVEDLQAGANSRIEDAGDYWRLISTVGNNSTGNTIIEVQIFPATAANGFLPNVAAAVGINRVWGMQMEVGAFATSYIPTTTVSVTRNKDDIQSLDVNWFNEPAGTFYLKLSTFGTDSVHYGIFVSDGGVTTDTHRMWIEPPGNARIRMSENSVNYQITGAAEAPTQFSNEAVGQVAWAYQTDDLMGFYDGAAETVPITTAVVASTIDELHIGQSGSEAQQLNGHIAELRYYNVRKDNAFLEALSNGTVPE